MRKKGKLKKNAGKWSKGASCSGTIKWKKKKENE